MATGWIRARAPATIANLGPGFDVFALAIRGLADEVAVRPAERDSLRVEGIDAADLPSTLSGNTAGIVIEALRAATGITQSLEICVTKGIPSGRGLGSSAASCAAAAVAFLRAFPKSRDLGIAGVLRAAVEGEAAVSGRHYDNLAAALLGGFVTLGSSEPLLLSRIPVNPRIALAIAIPRFVLRTADMRGILPSVVPLRDAVSNVGHAAILALALARGDSALAGRCLEDRFAEPVRAPFLPGYAEARSAVQSTGAPGFALCGSGSSVFAFAPDRTVAGDLAEAMCNGFRSRGYAASPFVTSVDNRVPIAGLLHRLKDELVRHVPGQARSRPTLDHGMCEGPDESRSAAAEASDCVEHPLLDHRHASDRTKDLLHGEGIMLRGGLAQREGRGPLADRAGQ